MLIALDATDDHYQESIESFEELSSYSFKATVTSIPAAIKGGHWFFNFCGEVQDSNGIGGSNTAQHRCSWRRKDCCMPFSSLDPNLLSALSVVFAGAFAAAYLISGDVLYLAPVFVMISAFFDAIDGKVQKWLPYILFPYNRS